MNKSCVLTVVAMICLVVMGGTARAQDPEGIVVSVPFEFIAGTKTMPAGTYKVGRISTDVRSALILSGEESSALVSPIVVDDASGVQPAALNFEQLGNRYFLSKVETPDRVYTIAVPRAMAMLVQVKDRGDALSAGTE
ncbi:MAG: hypothetical protein ABSF15_22205 [Candidatus Sulfotelmatobacter sp.]